MVDADINGPSIAKMLGVRGHALSMDAGGMYPALGPLDIRVISMDLFLKEDHTPVVWDGPQAETFVWRGTMEMHTLREFLTDVHWGELDILLLDLPPGSDRLTTLNDLLPNLHGSVVVTIPSAVSQLVVSKSITMARDLLRTPVIGLVENMTSYVCPDLRRRTSAVCADASGRNAGGRAAAGPRAVRSAHGAGRRQGGAVHPRRRRVADRPGPRAGGRGRPELCQLRESPCHEICLYRVR